MTTAAPTGVAAAGNTDRNVTLLLTALFAASGAAALVHEVAWFHLLRLAVGSSSLSLAFLLGSFLGGMGLGSWALPRVVAQHRHPLRVYAALELGIGALAAAQPLLLPWLARLYTEHLGVGDGALLWRGAVTAAALLLPAALIGATLPAIARWFDASRPGLARVGSFYAANLAGAVAGTVIAGFWAMPRSSAVQSTWMAAAVNIAVAVAAAAIARARPAPAPRAALPAAALRDAGPGDRVVLAAIALSGGTALAAQVVWTRQLSLLLGASTYTFALILAVFLAGLGVGSGAGARLVARSPRPRVWFGRCQLLLPPCIAWGSWSIVHLVPHAADAADAGASTVRAGDVARCALALLPATSLWGASFPLAAAAAGAGRPDPGRAVGGVAAANTLGGIAGALIAGAWATAVLGTRSTLQVAAAVAGGGALLLLLSPRPTGRRAGTPLGAAATVALVAVLVGIAAIAVPRVPAGMIAFGRTVGNWSAPVDYLWVAEGRNASIAVTEFEGYTHLHVSGKVVASTQPLDMRLQRMLGHLPGLVHGAPRSVLVVGCGAGVTAGCFLDYPGIERIVVCEIEPLVTDAARLFFGAANRGVLDDPRTEVVLDDARHFLATTRETFDLVTSDPIHPWVAGAAALYSAEYHELVRSRLSPGGIVTQWVPLYQTDEPTVKCQLATFLRAFPDATVWSSDPTRRGYDLVLMARAGHDPIDVGRIQREIDGNARLRGSLTEVGLGHATALLGTFVADGETLRPWLVDAETNLDAGLRLQYLAGRAIDVHRDAELHAAITARFRFPAALFRADGDVMTQLRAAMQR